MNLSKLLNFKSKVVFFPKLSVDRCFRYPRYLKQKWMQTSFPLLQGSKVVNQKLSVPKDNERTQPVESFILLEHYNAIQLAQQVHASLSSLAKVIKGMMGFDMKQSCISFLKKHNWYWNILFQLASIKENLTQINQVYFYEHSKLSQFWDIHKKRPSNY